MANRNLKALLGEVESELQQAQLSPAAHFRLRQLLFTRPQANRRRGLALAAAVVVLVTAVGVVLSRRTDGPARLADLEIITRSDDLRARASADGVVEIESGEVTLLDRREGYQFHAAAPARVRQESGGLRVLSSDDVLFTVEKRAANAAPMRVLVSEGAIEVLGTRFTVGQNSVGGSVRLHEGAIRFLDAQGEVRLAPGESLQWPRAVVVSPAPPLPPHTPERVPERRAAPLPPPVFSNPEDLLEHVDLLRRRGEHEEAVRLLTRGLSANYRPITRERLSYEKGSILTYLLGDASRACDHWSAHLRTYPDGRYGHEVGQALTHAGCGGRR